MPVLRYLTTIFVNLACVAVGGFLILIGLRTYTTLEVFKTNLERQKAMFADVEGFDPTQGMNFSAIDDMVITGILFFLGGLIIALLGLRGLLRRIRRGLPSEQIVDAETSRGRLIAGLVFGIGALWGGYAMILSLLDIAEHLPLRLAGQQATAVVEKTWNAKDPADERRYQSFLSYRFKTRDGETVRAEIQVPRTYVWDVKRGTRIDILYAPHDTSQTTIPELETWGRAFLFLGFYTFLVVFGVIGARRNLGFKTA